MRHVLRRLIQRPLFTTVAILTLGVGIGANTAIFSVIQGILLKPLPYPHPEDLVDVDHSAPGVGLKSAGAAPFLYFTYRSDAHALQDVGLWRGDTSSITGRGEPEEVDEVDVTYTVLPILGVQPAVGRPFSQKDDSPGSPETVIVTFGYWKSKLGGDTSVVGQTLLVDGRPREIIGILPDRFRFLDRKPALFIPLRLDPNKTFLGNFSYSGLARLTSGATIATANAEAAHLIPIALQRFPPFPGYSAKMFDDARLAPNVRPLKASLVGDIGNVLWVLMGTIGLVLLIACANVANLLLVRAEGRQQELAIRAALGAGSREVAHEILTESVLLGGLGGAVGLGLAYWALQLLVKIAPARLPRLDSINIDPLAMLFTLGISLLAGILFGLIPVIKYATVSVMPALRAGGRT